MTLVLAGCGSAPHDCSHCGNGCALSCGQTYCAALTPAALDFGPVPIGQSAHLAVDLGNCGNTPLNVGAQTLSGDPSFGLSGRLAGAQALGVSGTATVSFTPTSVAAVAGTLTVTTDSAPSVLSVALQGTGVAADAGQVADGG